MNIKEIEKSLCRIYINSKENQKRDLRFVKDHLKDKMANLRRQFPYDMEALCEKHGVE